MEDLFEYEERFNLTKNSYLTVGSIFRNCLKFFPSVKSTNTQQLFLGDARGVLYVTQYKKTEPEICTRTNPFPKEITSIETNPNLVKERMYFSFGNSILFTDRSCKEFSKIEFGIAEDITSFKACDNLIWTTYHNYVTKFEHGDITIDKGTYDNEALVTSLCLTEVLGKSNPISIIGSQNSKIKIVSGKDLIYSHPVSSAPTTISPYKMSLHDLSENNYLFGTSSGAHGILNIEKKDSMKILWESNNNKNLSEVVAMKVHDINYDGVNEIVLIRANGDVNIYSVGNTILDSNLISKFSTGEILTGLDIGKFRADDELELMLTSYSGLVFSLTPQINNKLNKIINVDKKSLTKNMKQLKEEVDALKDHYEKKLSEHQKQNNTSYNPISRNPFKVNYKFTLNPKEAAFNLKVESEFPIEIILMRSESIKIDVLEIITKDVNINNLTTKDKFSCTLKMKEGIHCVDIILRTYEGSGDILNMTVIPFNKPKTAQVIEIPIKALSLHRKFDKEVEEKILADEGVRDSNLIMTQMLEQLKDDSTLNILTIKGRFQSSELNQIFHLIVPDIPEKTTKESMTYLLKSTFLNTLIEIEIENNLCIIKSNFLSSLIILKEQITKEAFFQRKDMEFTIQVKTLSIFKMLERINPLIEENFNMEMKYKIMKAFQELDISKTRNSNDLPEEYMIILNRSEEISKKYKQRTINLFYLRSLVENLLKDVSKVKSIPNLKEQLQAVNQLFEDYSFERLIRIFKDLKNI